MILHDNAYIRCLRDGQVYQVVRPEFDAEGRILFEVKNVLNENIIWVAEDTLDQLYEQVVPNKEAAKLVAAASETLTSLQNRVAYLESKIYALSDVKLNNDRDELIEKARWALKIEVYRSNEKIKDLTVTISELRSKMFVEKSDV